MCKPILCLLLLLSTATAADRPQVSSEIQERAGHGLNTTSQTGLHPAPALPPGITLSGKLSESDAVAIALWNNAALEAALARLGLARADLIEAGLLRNPNLSTLLPVGPKPFELALTFPIEALWQRGRRVAAAEVTLKQVAAALVQSGLDVVRDARVAHSDLALAEQRFAVATEAAALRERIAKMTYLRLEAGDIGELEARLTRADADASADQAARLARDVDIARERLRLVLGLRKDATPLSAAPPETIAAPPPEWEALLETALASRPDLRAAELGVQAAAKRAGWERSRILALGPMLSTKGVGSNGIRSGPGFNFDIPLFHRNQGAISRAEADTERAAREYVALRDQVEAELRTARLELLRSLEALERIRGKLLPEAAENIRLSEKAYENGDVPYLTVLEASRQIHDVRSAGSRSRRRRAPRYGATGTQRGEKIMNRLSYVACALIAGAGLAAVGCGSPTKTVQAKAAPAVKVENGGIKEADLARITLTAQAEQRLGIETAVLEMKPAGRQRTFLGEIMIPPGQVLTVSAPVAGTLSAAPGGVPAAGARVKAGQALFHLLPMLPVQRDLRVIAESEVSAANTRVEAAKARKARAERMLRDRVGSVRAQEDADNELRLAQTALDAAKTKLDQVNRAPLSADVTVTIPVPQDGILRQVHAVAGQAVSGGAPLFEVARFDPLWVRVPVYTGDVALLQPGAAARVEAVNGKSAARSAAPVTAPPTADPLAATSDLYYALPNPDAALRPGEKVSVTLPLRGGEQALLAPWAAVLHDIHGGAWVYENVAAADLRPPPRARSRARRARHGRARPAARPPARKIVTDGAAELFGTEFGAGQVMPCAGSSSHVRCACASLVVALAVVLMVVGIRTVRNAPLDVFPEFAPPLVEIQTEAPGLSTEEVESLVTVPLENALNGIAVAEDASARSRCSGCRRSC